MARFRAPNAVSRGAFGVFGNQTQAEQMTMAGRNHRALLLFSRAAITTLAIVSAALGFLTGARMQSADYDPNIYAMGAGALFAAACTVIAFMLYRRRIVRTKIDALEA